MRIESTFIKKILFLLMVALFGVIPISIHPITPDVHVLDKRMAKVAEESQVIRVVDGDTIVIALNRKPKTVRLLGINTPETVAPNNPVQCFGSEASARTKKLLTNQIVRLEADPSQDDRDKYDRLLRFVFLENQNVNESLVRDGYAREYTYKIPYKYQQEFRSVQREAKKEKRGLWGVCN